MSRKIILGTRGSALAIWQADFVKRRLERSALDRTFEIKVISTTGDQIQEVTLAKINDKGLFTRQIEAQLLDHSIDIAVHSLKDLQTDQPDGLEIGAICERERPNDVLVSRQATTIAELPDGARVATGSLRRRSQLLNLRPDLHISDIRGNVPTRLERFISSDLDAMILAFAGVHRLGLAADMSHIIPADIMIPAVGQGSVAAEIRADDTDIKSLMAFLDHETSHVCATAERAFLRRLEGGCQVPIGALAEAKDGELRVSGVVAMVDGSKIIRDSISGRPQDAEELGVTLAGRVLDRGAGQMVAASREASKGAV